MEVGALDRLQVDEVVDQGEQVAARRGDVAGIAGIIVADRPLALGADRLGAGDDPGERRPQRLVEPLAERARLGLGPELDRRGRRAPAGSAAAEPRKPAKRPAPSISGIPASR